MARHTALSEEFQGVGALRLWGANIASLYAQLRERVRPHERRLTLQVLAVSELSFDVGTTPHMLNHRSNGGVVQSDELSEVGAEPGVLPLKVHASGPERLDCGKSPRSAVRATARLPPG